MRLSEKNLRVGGLVAVLAACAAVAGAQPPQQQQQQIPDAPKPQTLPQLKTITPVAPAAELPSAPAPALNTTLPAGDTPDAPVPTALPSSPKTQTPDAEQEPAPEGMKPGEGVGTFTIKAVNVNFVEVPFTVKDNKNHLVPGITYRDVRVYENNVRQTPRVFTTDPFPLSVALVIDQSVTFDVMEKINRSLAALQGAFTPYDEVALFTYNNGVRAQGDGKFTAAQSARLSALLERSKGKGRDPVMGLGGPLAHGAIINNQAVPSAEPNSNSGGISIYPEKEFHTLNDAILAAGQATTKAGKGRRRIVFVISDGKEYGSTAKEKDVIKYLQTNKVAVYATLVGDSAIPGLGFLDRVHLPLTMRDNALPRYAAATGGQIDPEFRQGGIEQSFAKITEEVRTQYTVGYYSHEPLLDGKFRKIEVRVLRPGLTVIAKEGYYPAASDSRPAPVTPTAVP